MHKNEIKIPLNPIHCQTVLQTLKHESVRDLWKSRHFHISQHTYKDETTWSYHSFSQTISILPETTKCENELLRSNR